MKLSIIILSYNTKNVLKQCLSSLFDSLKHECSPGFEKNTEVIVIDNASVDDSVSMIKSEFPEVSLIVNRKNVGFGKGNNQGMEMAKGTYYWLLNSDTEIKGNTPELLVDFMDSNREVGIATPKVMLPDGAIDLACHRGMPTPWNAFTYFTKLEQLAPEMKLFSGYHQTYKDFSTIHEIEAAAATAIIVRKKAVDKVGGFDEAFFLYGEDLDWCKRMTNAGWKIMYVPHAIVVHHKSISGKKNKSKKERQKAAFHFYETMKIFYEKHYATTYPKWLRQLVYAGINLKKKLHR